MKNIGKQPAAAAATAIQQHATEQHQHKNIYKCKIVRHPSACRAISVFHVKEPCCETSLGIHVTKRETAAVITTHSRAAAAASAALCTHMKLISRLLRRHLNHYRTYLHASLQSHTIPTDTGTIKGKPPINKNTLTPSSRTRTTDITSKRHKPTCSRDKLLT